MIWKILTEHQLSIVDDLDNMERSMQSNEAKFLDDIIKKLDAEGDDQAEFSAKQIAWIESLGRKYLDS